MGADLCEPCCQLIREFIHFRPGDAERLPVEPSGPASRQVIRGAGRFRKASAMKGSFVAKIHMVLSAEPVESGSTLEAFCGEKIPNAQAIPLGEFQMEQSSSVLFCRKCLEPAISTQSVQGRKRSILLMRLHDLQESTSLGRKSHQAYSGSARIRQDLRSRNQANVRDLSQKTDE